MDRRHFLPTQPPRGRHAARAARRSSRAAAGPGDAALNAAFNTRLHGQRVAALARTRDVARLRQGPGCAAEAPAVRSRAGCQEGQSGAHQGRDRRDRRRRRSGGAVERCAAQPRRRALFSSIRRSSGQDRFGVDSPQRPFTITQQGGVVFLDPRFPQFVAHDRHRRRCRGVSRSHRRLRQGARPGQRSAGRAGGARLSRARFLARPGARPDGGAAQARAGRQHADPVDRPPHRRQDPRRLGRALRQDRRRSRSIPRSTARSRW